MQTPTRGLSSRRGERTTIKSVSQQRSFASSDQLSVFSLGLDLGDKNEAGKLVPAAETCDEINKLVKSNQTIIRRANVFCSLEGPFGRFSFKRRWMSAALAQTRFCFFLWISIRMVLFWVFQSCEYAPYRAYLFDWTTFYPEARRVSLVRSILCLCLFQLTFKRSVLFGRPTRKKFDTSLIDFLCAPPPPCDSRPRDEPTAGAFDEGDDDSLFERRLDEYLAQDTPPNDQNGERFTSTPSLYLRQTGRAGNTLALGIVRDSSLSASSFSPLNKSSPIMATPNRKNVILRNREHWLRVSRGFKATTTKTIFYIIPVSLVIILSSVRRLLFVHQVNRECDIRETFPVTRYVGGLELIYGLFECLVSLYGLTLHTSLVALDIHHQIDIIQRELHETDRRLKSENSSQSDETALSVYSPRQPKLVGRRAYCAASDNQLALPGARSPKAPRDVSYSNHLFARLSLNYLNDFWSRTNLSAEDQSWFRSLFQSAHHKAIQGAVFNDPDQHELGPIQTKVIQMLGCIDSHKALVAFLGNPQFIWMATSLSFVPLMTFKRDMSREDKLGLFIYVYLFLIPVIASMRFTIVCANVNQRALHLATLIFRICTNCNERSIIRRWNKIFMIWYCPNRCAFRVAGLIDLTYVNILKTISFLLSGITLMLNYANN